MCMGCWEEDGRPWEKTERAVKWAHVFADADYAGPLHVVVGDWNLDDGNIRFCRGEATSATDIDLCEALLSMSMGERYATAILADDPNFDPAKWAANRDD